MYALPLSPASPRPPPLPSFSSPSPAEAKGGDVKESEFAHDEVQENGEDEDLKTFSDDDEEVQAELDAFWMILVETFNEIDIDNAAQVSAESLGTIMDSLLEEVCVGVFVCVCV